MGVDLLELVRVLEELQAFLRQFEEQHWSEMIENDLFFLRKGDLYGARRFLGYFGGMGSFNDLWLCEANGHAVPDDVQQRVNAELDRLKSRAWALANEAASNV